jgi:predicted nucleic acid-binding protein
MITERIVISDTNIILDLLFLNMLDDFFSLPCDICTTDLVIDEIVHPAQQKIIDSFVKSRKLEVVQFSPSEFSNITNLFVMNPNNASLTDCSVWYYAKQTNGRLLTGDGKLRKAAENDNVKVSGILYVFDNLIEYEILSRNKAADLLENLIKVNMRLPKDECEKRILTWRNISLQSNSPNVKLTITSNNRSQK